MKSCLSHLRIIAPLSLLSAGSALAQAPANNNFAAAEAFAGGTVAGSTVNATAESGEPASHIQNAASGKSVWYNFTPAASGLYLASVVGTDATPVAHNVAVYTGTAVNSLIRVAGISAFQANVGSTYRIQVTGAAAAGSGAFSLTVDLAGRQGLIVLPFFSNWDYLHPLAGEDPTTDTANWSAKWKIPGDTTVFASTPTTTFTLNKPAPLGYGGIDRVPGSATVIGSPSPAANNNAAYFRTSFTLSQPTSNLWAEVLCDDGAYIYVDNFPGIPVHIAAKLAGTAITTAPAINDYRPQVDAHITGAIPTTAGTSVPGCRAYTPTGYDTEKNTQMVFIGGATGLLAAGTHTIAVSAHQTGTGSSDMGFDMQLIDFPARSMGSGLGTTFTDVPFVAAASGVVPVVEHQFAPNAGQTDLAWYAVSPDTRAATVLRGAAVVTDTTLGTNKALRLNGAEVNRFVTEPVSISGKASYTASIKIRTNDTSSGFETGDGFRVFLETSTDGINFSEPTPKLELQSQVNGAAALDPFKTGFVTMSLAVTGNTATAARMVITGGTDSTSETIYFDDIEFSDCQIFAVSSTPIYHNLGDDDPKNDTITFDLTVTGAGTTGPGWTTTGFAPDAEATGLIGGAAVSITRPATDTVTGLRKNVVFSVSDDGKPSCTASVTVVPTVAAIGAVTLSPAVRLVGADANDPSDDLYEFTVDAAGTATGVHYEIRSNDTGNTILYGTGAYGTVSAAVSVPLGTASVVLIDIADPTAKKTVNLNLAGTAIAVGKTNFGGVIAPIYNDITGPTASFWRQATANGGDASLILDAYTSVLNAGAATSAAQGTLSTPQITVTGKSNVTLNLRLRAFENSTGSGFETPDTFKIEVDVDTGGSLVTHNLITGDARDADSNGLLNGYSTTTAAPYDSNKSNDEFNLDLAAMAGDSAGTFDFTYNVPAGADKVVVRIVGQNDSANEKFFIQNLLVTDNTSAPTADDDGDGASNAEEAIAGTNPNDASSVFRIAGLTPDGMTVGLFHAGFATVSGKFYQGYYSTDLAIWTRDDSAAVIAGDGNAATWPFTPVPNVGQPKRFLLIMVSGSAGSFPATLP